MWNCSLKYEEASMGACVHGRIILKRVLKEHDLRAWTGLTWLVVDANGVLFANAVINP
jgi:hypothetical protein